VVSSSYVASFAVLTEEERQLGGTLVDMGSQNTTIASWQHGVCTHVGGFQLGSSHITSDIAYGLGVSLQDAEHVKTLYGHATVIAQDASVVLDLPCMSHHVETYGPLTRAALGEIIFARIEEWCAWLDREMDSMQLDPMARSKIILTGGGSQLLGLADAIGSLLKGGPMVRLGLPSYDHLVFHETMASMSLQRPHYAVALGFLKFALGRLQESRYHGEHPLGPMDRCWRWLRQWKERLVPC
jgi:cell division protein FtsA